MLPLPSNHHTARASSAANTALTAVIQAQAAAAVDLLHLTTISPFQNHSSKRSFPGQLLIHRPFSGPPESSQNN